MANALAVSYWTAQVIVLTPPWFAFAGQLEIVRGLAIGGLAAAALLSAILWRSARPTH